MLGMGVWVVKTQPAPVSRWIFPLISLPFYLLGWVERIVFLCCLIDPSFHISIIMSINGVWPESTSPLSVDYCFAVQAENWRCIFFRRWIPRISKFSRVYFLTHGSGSSKCKRLLYLHVHLSMMNVKLKQSSPIGAHQLEGHQCWYADVGRLFEYRFFWRNPSLTVCEESLKPSATNSLLMS